MSPAYVVGQLVKINAPGRTFEAPILVVRPDAVDVRDPHNGGRRTIALARVEPTRPTCEACGAEVPKGKRRSQDAEGRLVCAGCR